MRRTDRLPSSAAPSPVGATLRSPNHAPTTAPPPRRKSIRLSRETYTGWLAFSVTVRTGDHHRAFAHEENVRLGISTLEEAAEHFGMHVLAYCFMPDHVHLLLEGRDHTNLIDFMKRFKQRAGYHYKQTEGRPLWQKGYFDHILRREESIDDVARYIFQNPVRGGLVTDPTQYRWSGGEVHGDVLEGRPEGRPYDRGNR